MLAGSIVALVTPMHRSGEVDWAALDRLIDWHVESGTHGIVPVGTTGESRDAQRRRAHQGGRAHRRARGQADSGDRRNGCEFHVRSNRVDAQSAAVGADACLLVTPYYNRPTQEGLYQHYKAIAAAVDVPQVLYNVPAQNRVRHEGRDGRTARRRSTTSSASKRRAATSNASRRFAHALRRASSFCPAKMRRRST